MKLKKFLMMGSLMTASFMMCVPEVMAHGVWFAKRLDQIQLVCGEGPKDNAYDPNGLTSIQGYDAKYNKVTVEPVKAKDHLTINPKEGTAVVAVNFDYGYWSNNAEGKWVPYPMDQVEGSTIGTHAIKYSVNYLGSVEKVKPVEDMAYQFVPSVDPTKLNIGDKFTVTLMHNGKPMPNVEIIPDVINHHTVTIKTDGNGKAVVTACNGGVNVIGAEMVVPYENAGKDKKATRSKAFVSLSFTLYPEETE